MRCPCHRHMFGGNNLQICCYSYYHGLIWLIITDGVTGVSCRNRPDKCHDMGLSGEVDKKGINRSILTLILLITTIDVFNQFYSPINSLLLGMKLLSKHQDLQMFSLKLNKYE